MSSGAPLIYYEDSWAILSTIGIANLLFGIAVIGITALSPLTIIPVVVSIALAVANGLCFFAYYAQYPIHQQIIAGAFADVLWLVQESGITFYSFFILRRLIKNRAWTIFVIIFSLMNIIATAIRISILITRVRLILSGTNDLQPVVNRLHIGYFVSLAVVEIAGAGFLLQKFASAKKRSKVLATSSNLFSYLMGSTEIRISLLALLGIARAITHSFQVTAQTATGVASQLDRFVYTLQCMFPIMLMIDVLASRLAFNKDAHGYPSASNGHISSRSRRTDKAPEEDIRMSTIVRHGGIQTIVKARSRIGDHKSGIDSSGSSAEHIVDPVDFEPTIESGIMRTMEVECSSSRMESSCDSGRNENVYIAPV